MLIFIILIIILYSIFQIMWKRTYLLVSHRIKNVDFVIEIIPKQVLKKYRRRRKDRRVRRIYTWKRRFCQKNKALVKDKNISAEIANSTRLKNIYESDEIIAAVAGYYNRTEKDLIEKKGRWNREKQMLMYLLSGDAGKITRK
jgi:hypothetical protein